MKGKVVSAIANFHWKNKQHQKAKEKYLEALEILEESVVPPILPYHQIYRSYGLVLYDNKEFEEAKEVLRQTVDMINKFINHSEDEVSENSEEHATAMTYLITLEPEEKEEWIEKAYDYWSQIEEKY